MELQLRDYQTETAELARQAFRAKNRSILIVLPCGAGKTVLFAYIAQQAQKKGNKVLFLVHRGELLDQTIATFDKFGIIRDTIDIAMVQKTANLFKKGDITAYDLIIFDEVQKYPSAREMIKYLVQDGRYDYLETGSLITIMSKAKKITIPSEEESVQLYPMDFEEFLWALGDTVLFDAAKRSYENSLPVGNPLHRKLIERFRQYMVVGGMPQAVEAFVNEKNYFAAEKAKRLIIKLYREDISKARKTLVEKTRRIYDLVPSQLSRHEKKFVLSDIKSGASYENYQKAFQWLEDAKLINLAYNSQDPNIGLKLTKDDSSFKCYLGDTGLLLTMVFDENPETAPELMKKIAMGKLEFNKGMLIENIVAQTFVSSGRKLYFYSSYSRDAANRMEVDFLLSKAALTNKHNIVPVEVKSSTNYTLSSLRKYIAKFDSYVTSPIVLHFNDYEQKDWITYLPIYMASLL